MTETQDYLAEAIAAAEANNVAQLRSVFQAWEDDGARSPPKGNAHWPLAAFNPVVHKAIEKGHVEILGACPQLGFRPDFNWLGDDAWLAMNRGATEANNWNIKTFDFLIAHGWNVDQEFTHMGTILTRAVINDKIPLVRYLMDKGANPLHGMCSDMYNAVDCAVIFGSCEGLSLLLTRVPPEKINDGCSSSLWLAAMHGKIDKLNILLAAKVDPDFVSEDPESMLHLGWESQLGWGTALHAAAWMNQIEAIKILLAAGADKTARNIRGLTPNDVAREAQQDEAAQLLE